MKTSMSPRERLERVLGLEVPDRVPIGDGLFQHWGFIDRFYKTRAPGKWTLEEICTAVANSGVDYAFIPDLIGAGYEVLNPIQTTAAEMDPVRLKKEFGRDLVFWGAVDTQRVLPFKTPEDVKNDVKRTIEALAPGGGYILAPCHNIQANVPPKNVAAVFEAARECGGYPIQRTG